MTMGRPVVAPPSALSRIAVEVASAHGLSTWEMFTSRRLRRLVLARQEFFWRARRETKASYPQIAEFANLLDHTTVIHGERRHEELVEARKGLM